jgi:hypothetical protein
MKLAEKISKHPLVEELYKDSDGWWANLVDGYVCSGCVAIHETSLSRIWESLRFNVMTRKDYYQED